MLDSTDSNANLKVIDFGTSRFFRKGQAMTNEYGTVTHMISNMKLTSTHVVLLYCAGSIRQKL